MGQIKDYRSSNSESMQLVVLSDRSDLHLSVLERVPPTTPGSPVDSVGKTVMWTTQVETVEVGVVTLVVPPSAFEQLRTGTMRISVMVSVECREHHSTMYRQRISCKFTIRLSQIHDGANMAMALPRID